VPIYDIVKDMIPKVYIDTSVIGDCFDSKFSAWSILLFEEFRKGIKIAVVSDLTHRELENAPSSVKRNFQQFQKHTLRMFFFPKKLKS
jgi:hypothetical protein